MQKVAYGEEVRRIAFFRAGADVPAWLLRPAKDCMFAVFQFGVDACVEFGPQGRTVRPMAPPKPGDKMFRIAVLRGMAQTVCDVPTHCDETPVRDARRVPAWMRELIETRTEKELSSSHESKGDRYE